MNTPTDMKNTTPRLGVGHRICRRGAKPTIAGSSIEGVYRRVNKLFCGGATLEGG